MPKSVKLKLTLSDSTIIESNTFTIPDRPEGPQGNPGAQGAPGAPGAPGAQGAPGVAGKDGATISMCEVVEV